MDSVNGGGSDDRLAPVIPLFGARTATGEAADDRTGDDVANRVELPGDERGLREAEASAVWHSSWTDLEDQQRAAEHERETDDAAAIERNIAEKSLLKKLRTRSLSVREARAVLAERELDGDAIDGVLDGFLRRGYLDDAALAEQLIHAGVDRKGQGRQVIAQTLAKRGVPREVADAALAALPDDDLDRALEFARAKIRSLRDVDRDTALRRLMGQLSRRGYPGSVAMTAARQALDEQSPGHSGVRFR
ncbi:RecX family transcriptional regulator [Microbacterium sp. HD4P20]|uniref:regulatory protein RecX n=1 Tax=Microbacterium sp. HD4P20 TaxID=2864874 RepID=UPI0020A3C34B|nr:regulatory protein RecX [Microbacterium sp. HD4P20]MCP2637268.1 RecX family transcriptional regulator [Microbacterium sp. HD4P20]